MLLYRLGSHGRYAGGNESTLRYLLADPWGVPAAVWRWGEVVEPEDRVPRAPVRPGKIVGVGRNYREHAAELGNPMPAEPLLFLKATSSVIGPGETVVLPPESQEVHFEGEIALVLGATLRRGSPQQAAAALLGVTCACDVTARDLQQRDRTFARGKSFDTFCPLGPAIAVGGASPTLTVVTRLNGEERQRGSVAEMAWPPLELLSFISHYITLEPGDVVLSGTPAGVGQLAEGDSVEVEIPGVGVLGNPVAAWRGAPT
jgi:2-keto-4-pentenoate hydratase/2-oxohepta-3-ene-1,7-dioic acid hydratase in catechol pathway